MLTPAASRIIYAALGLLLFWQTSLPMLAQAPREYALKAVFLWRLAQFVTWPPRAFTSDGAPIVIGVSGRNPFGDALSLAIKNESAHGRPLEVRYNVPLDQAGACHILFVTQTDAAQAERIVRHLAGSSVLTVSDIPGFANMGGMVEFFAEQDKMRIRINREAIAMAELVLDARLLRLADVVGGRATR